MNSSRTKTKLTKTNSTIQNFFKKLFCFNKKNPDESENKENIPTTMKSRQYIHLSLIGSYKASVICKISRKNFIATQRQILNNKMPSAIVKFLSEKIDATQVLFKGQINPKIIRKIPYSIKLINSGETSKGQCVIGELTNIRLRFDELSIFRPQFEKNKIPSLLEDDYQIGKQMCIFANKFQNSIFILPKQIVLDELGILFSDMNKFIQIQTIVANGLSLYHFVYVGTSQFVSLTAQQQMQYIVKQLQKDLKQENNMLSELISCIYKRSSIHELLFLLKKSINEADVDTVLTCFIKNALFRQYVCQLQIAQFLPNLKQQNQIQTPIFRLTGRFNSVVSSPHFRRTCEQDDFLNGRSNSLLYQNSVQTFAQTLSPSKGVIRKQYIPI